MLLERIDGELAEVREGLVEVDEKTARLHGRLSRLELRVDSSRIEPESFSRKVGA